MPLLRDPFVIAVSEPTRVVGTRCRVAHDLDDDIPADPNTITRRNRGPVNPGQGKVLPGASRLDRVAFGPKGFDDLEGEEADGAVATAVNLGTPLPVPAHAIQGNLGLRDRPLRHTAVRHTDLMQVAHTPRRGQAPCAPGGFSMPSSSPASTMDSILNSIQLPITQHRS